MAKIFISYSSRDAEIADQVYHALIAADHQVWMDREALKGGQDWLQAIQDNLLWANTLIVLWSAHALHSEWVQDEITFARSKRKLIIPLRIDNTDPSNHIIINALQLVDLRDGNVQRAVQHINAAIESPIRPGSVSSDSYPRYSPLRRYTWLVGAVLIIALSILILPSIMQPDPLQEPIASATPSTSITASPQAQITPLPTTSAQPATVETLNAWRQSRGYASLHQNPTLQEIANVHLGYLRSLSLTELEQTNLYRNADGYDAQWMAENGGYAGQVQMFVEVNEDNGVLLDDLLFEFETQNSTPDFHTRYRDIGLVAEQALNTGRYYFVLILGTGQ
jgi:hypothetical protein